MKILRFFFYGLLGVFVVFVLIGVVKPTITYESEVTIGAGVHKSWSVFTDSTRMDEWAPAFQSIAAVEGTDGAERYELTVRENGTTYSMIETVVERKEQEKYVFDLENDVMVNRVSYTFEDMDGKTHLVASESLRGKGILMKPIFVFMQGMFQDTQQQTLNDLKAAIEKS